MRIYFIIILIFAGCASANPGYMQADRLSGDSEILNYEYSNRYFAEQIRKEHFQLNIEIDEPALITINPDDIDDIYSVADIRGDAIVAFKTDENGKIVSYKIKKSAGLGLDKYVKDIINKLKIKPVSHRGINGNSQFNARFIFESRGKL
jgi:hypothetical protein